MVMVILLRTKRSRVKLKMPVVQSSIFTQITSGDCTAGAFSRHQSALTASAKGASQ